MKLQLSEFKLIERKLIFYTKLEGRITFGQFFEENELYEVFPNWYVSYDKKRVYFAEIKDSVQDGIRWIMPLLEKSITQTRLPIIITIDTFESIWVDFQPEIMKIAVPKWLAENLGFSLPIWEYQVIGDSKRIEIQLK